MVASGPARISALGRSPGDSGLAHYATGSTVKSAAPLRARHLYVGRVMLER